MSSPGAYASAGLTPTPIKDLFPAIDIQESRIIFGSVGVTWPYNSITRTIAFVLTESYATLRGSRGRIRVRINGSGAEAVAKLGLGPGDEVALHLEGSEWKEDEWPSRNAATRLEWQLNFPSRVVLEVTLSDTKENHKIDIAQSTEPEPPNPIECILNAPVSPSPIVPALTADSPENASACPEAPDVDAGSAYFTPFKQLKRKRDVEDDGQNDASSLFSPGYNFFESETPLFGSHKRRSTGFRTWRVISRSPSPDPEPTTPQLDHDMLADESLAIVDVASAVSNGKPETNGKTHRALDDIPVESPKHVPEAVQEEIREKAPKQVLEEVKRMVGESASPEFQQEVKVPEAVQEEVTPEEIQDVVSAAGIPADHVPAKGTTDLPSVVQEDATVEKIEDEVSASGIPTDQRTENGFSTGVPEEAVQEDVTIGEIQDAVSAAGIPANEPTEDEIAAQAPAIAVIPAVNTAGTPVIYLDDDEESDEDDIHEGLDESLHEGAMSDADQQSLEDEEFEEEQLEEDEDDSIEYVQHGSVREEVDRGQSLDEQQQYSDDEEEDGEGYDENLEASYPSNELAPAEYTDDEDADSMEEEEENNPQPVQYATTPSEEEQYSSEEEEEQEEYDQEEEVYDDDQEYDEEEEEYGEEEAGYEHVHSQVDNNRFEVISISSSESEEDENDAENQPPPAQAAGIQPQEQLSNYPTQDSLYSYEQQTIPQPGLAHGAYITPDHSFREELDAEGEVEYPKFGHDVPQAGLQPSASGLEFVQPAAWAGHEVGTIAENSVYDRSHAEMATDTTVLWGPQNETSAATQQQVNTAEIMDEKREAPHDVDNELSRGTDGDVLATHLQQINGNEVDVVGEIIAELESAVHASLPQEPSKDAEDAAGETVAEPEDMSPPIERPAVDVIDFAVLVSQPAAQDEDSDVEMTETAHFDPISQDSTAKEVSEAELSNGANEQPLEAAARSEVDEAGVDVDAVVDAIMNDVPEPSMEIDPVLDDSPPGPSSTITVTETVTVKEQLLVVVEAPMAANAPTPVEESVEIVDEVRVQHGSPRAGSPVASDAEEVSMQRESSPVLESIPATRIKNETPTVELSSSAEETQPDPDSPRQSIEVKIEPAEVKKEAPDAAPETEGTESVVGAEDSRKEPSRSPSPSQQLEDEIQSFAGRTTRSRARTISAAQEQLAPSEETIGGRVALRHIRERTPTPTPTPSARSASPAPDSAKSEVKVATPKRGRPRTRAKTPTPQPAAVRTPSVESSKSTANDSAPPTAESSIVAKSSTPVQPAHNSSPKSAESQINAAAPAAAKRGRPRTRAQTPTPVPSTPRPARSSSVEMGSSQGAASAPTAAQSPTSADLKPRISSALPECIALNRIHLYINKVLDVLVIATSSTQINPRRTRAREYASSFFIADPSTTSGDGPAVMVAELYRPHRDSLPKVEVGDAVLLRRFKVKSLPDRGFGLQSIDESSWAVFDGGGEPQINGPPMEDIETEGEYAKELRAWYTGLVSEEMEKIEEANVLMLAATAKLAKR